MFKKNELDNITNIIKIENNILYEENVKINVKLKTIKNEQLLLVEEYNSKKREYNVSFNNLKNELENLTGDLKYILDNMEKRFDRTILKNHLIDELADEILYTKINLNIDKFKYFDDSDCIKEIYNLNKWFDFKCENKLDLNELLKNDNLSLRSKYDKIRFKRDFVLNFNENRINKKYHCAIKKCKAMY